MAYATGRRLTAALLWIVGGITVIGIPIFWPMAYLIGKQAKRKEKAAEERAEIRNKKLEHGH